MRKTLLILVIVTFCNIAANAQDWSKFGLKGKVVEASVCLQGGDKNDSQLKFYSNGNIKEMRIETPSCYLDVDDFSTSSTGYSGSYSDNPVTVTISGGKITKATYSNEDGNYTSTYQYSADGFLTKIIEVRKYQESDQVWVTTHSNYVAQANSYLRKYNTAYQKHRWAQARAYWAKYLTYCSLAANDAGGYYKDVYTNRTETKVQTYYNYVTDDLGKWTQRKMTDNDGDVHTQVQSITYEPNFYSKYQWEKLLQSGNLDDIHAFALASTTTQNYKNAAATYWNSHIMDEVEQKYNNNTSALCSVASDELTSPQIKAQALDMARRKIYSEQVLPETDYRKVADYAELSSGGLSIFDDSYKSKILSRSNQLKEDSIAGLKRRAMAEFDKGDYNTAWKLAKTGLSIDNTNNDLDNIRSEAEYEMLQKKIAAHTQVETDYETFALANANSPHLSEVNDARVNYALDKAGEYATLEELERIKGLPMSSSLYKKVAKKYDHRYFVVMRGAWCNIGMAGHFGIGPGLAEYGGGLGMRFGYLCNIFNVYLGAEYDAISYSKIGYKVDEDGAYLGTSRITCPAMLRLNFSHNYDYAAYIGAGVNVSFPLSSFFIFDKDGERVHSKSDKNLLNSSSTQISPRFAIGACTNNAEIELYCVYETKSIYNKDVVWQEGSSYFLNEKAVENQINNKWRIGVALRILF